MLFLIAGALAFSQSQGDTKQRARTAHDLAKDGEQGIPKLAPYVTDQIVDGYVEVRPEAIEALGRQAVSGASIESRANACRALGILRGRTAIPQLAEALHSKDNQTMYEALVALQKIRDVASASRVTFLVNDLDERVQVTAIQTAGMLLDHEAAPDVRDAMGRTRSLRVRHAAAAALAMLADPADRDSFLRDLADTKDDDLRAAGAEGLGRLNNPADRSTLEKAFTGEHKVSPRLSEAFAVVSLGNVDTGEFSSLRYLVNTLNQKLYQGLALPGLVELARDQAVRQALYPLLAIATKDEKIELGTVLARSGEKDSLPYLEALSTDPDTAVAQDGIRDLRSLKARLP